MLKYETSCKTAFYFKRLGIKRIREKRIYCMELMVSKRPALIARKERERKKKK